MFNDQHAAAFLSDCMAGMLKYNCSKRCTNAETVTARVNADGFNNYACMTSLEVPFQINIYRLMNIAPVQTNT